MLPPPPPPPPSLASWLAIEGREAALQKSSARLVFKVLKWRYSLVDGEQNADNRQQEHQSIFDDEPLVVCMSRIKVGVSIVRTLGILCSEDPILASQGTTDG